MNWNFSSRKPLYNPKDAKCVFLFYHLILIVHLRTERLCLFVKRPTYKIIEENKINRDFPSTAVPCTEGLDIGIILDKSRSVKVRNLRTVIKFLGSLVQKFNPAPDRDHFGFITFNNNAKLVFSFADSEYYEKDALLAKLASEPLTMAFKTRTDLALEMARDKLFTESGGDRPDKPNILIVLTDGKPNIPKKAKVDFKEFADTINKEFKAGQLKF